MLQEPVKLTKKTVRTSLLPPTTIWRRYYLHTGNVSLECIPRLNVVHQVARDLETSAVFDFGLGSKYAAVLTSLNFAQLCKLLCVTLNLAIS